MVFGAVPRQFGRRVGTAVAVGRRIALVGTIAAMAERFNATDPTPYPDLWVHLLSGATLLGAFFIATDLVTSPVSPLGKIVFGAGCGVLVYIIRTWAGYPEGIAFAVLIMNAATPLIDRYIKPRVYGRTRQGKPLAYEEAST